MKDTTSTLVYIILIISIIQGKKNEVTQKNFNDLQNLLNNTVNPLIDLDYDYIFNPDEDKTEGIIIKRNLIIDGKNKIINGLNKAKIFEISNTDVTLKNINFFYGFSKDFGSAINLINSSLNILNCTFFSNNANINGGAINSYNSNLNISESTFKYNNAKSLYACGGGISTNLSMVKIIKSIFINNSADEGGAIYSINTTFDISDSIFYDNTAIWYGGALISDSDISIENSSFYKNKAGYKGGAIHSTCSRIIETSLNINNSIIYNNSAEYGGAISSSNGEHVYIYNSEIYENNALYGGLISRTSRNNIHIINSSCYGNTAINGSILYSVAGGNNVFINDDINNNKADVGGIIYTISGRFLNQITNFNSTFINCKLIDNQGKKGLIYSIYDDLIIKSSNITFKTKLYDIPIIYKIVSGKVIEENNWWGMINPDLSKLIVYDYYDNIYNKNLLNKNNILDEGCSSTIIQMDRENFAFSFRRDSTASVYVNIIYQKNGILQYKTDSTFFWHSIISNDGWIIGTGGTDSPHQSEKLEAFGKIMIKENNIIDKFLEDILKIKSLENLGHFFIKAPNGNYGLIGCIKSEGTFIIEKGKLENGEYIIIPNDYKFYQKGKIIDLKIKENNYTYISRYLAAIDQYSSKRTNIFTYIYTINNNYGYKTKYVDIFVANDDGSLSNKTNTSNYRNDIHIKDKYILAEDVPIIMDGMYLDRYFIEKNTNLHTNLKLNIGIMTLIYLLILI